MLEETKTETETKTEEKPQLHKFTYNGEVVELDDTQLNRAVYLGLSKAQELVATKDDEKEKPKEEKKPVDDDEGPDLKSEIDKLREEIRANENSRANMARFNSDLHTIGVKLKEGNVDPEFMEDLTIKILANYNDAKAKNLPVNVADIASKAVDFHTKRMSRYQAKVDPEDKKKDKEALDKVQTGGRSAGQEKLPALGRGAFRNGELAKRVGSKIAKMLDKATE